MELFLVLNNVGNSVSREEAMRIFELLQDKLYILYYTMSKNYPFRKNA